MRRVTLILTMTTILSAMLLLGASSSFAQTSTPVCEALPQQEWRQYWDLNEAWWWFLWYRDCYSPEEGSFRVYEGWDWGPQIS
jgi:hypothetical protein